MRITIDHGHDAKLDDIVELLTTAGGLSSIPPGALDAEEVETGEHGGHPTLRWVQRYELDASESPSRLISKLVHVDVSVEWTFEHERAAGRVSTRISGAPVEAEAVHVIEPTEDGCVSTIRLDLTTHVPMMGGHLLSAVESTARQRIGAYLDGLDLALSMQPR
jgi:hypothetical protein